MSGIPGLFNRDGRPSDPSVVGAMIAAAAYRGPEGARCWTSGSVAIGHQQMGRLPEDVPQPIVDSAREIALAFDGRIDNRGDLLALVASRATAFRTPSDAELVLMAYDRWGEDCPVHLLGDFAFAIWDGERQRMFCARDVMGIKPFYYALTPRTFAWASDLRQILVSGVVPSRVPNEGMIAEYLAKSPQSHDETLYAGVMRLPPAHSMVVTADHVRLRRYWQIDALKDVTYGADGEYAEHFRQLLNDAVRCRLRSDTGKTVSYLSGGLDSSSVVATSFALGRPIETFSLVFPDDPVADESIFIEEVSRRWSITAHTVAAPPIDGAVCRSHVERRMDTLDLPADLVSEALMARMRDLDVRVALTGVGGDYYLSGSVYHYADLLKSGDLAGFLRQMLADRTLAGAAWSAWQPLLAGVRPLIPAAWRRAARPAARRLGLVPSLPDWIEPAFAARVSLADRIRPRAWTEKAPTFSRQRVCELFDAGWTSTLLENGERSAAEYGFEERHPFFDRRLIEFGVAIPESQRWKGQHTKYVLREAMRGLLPERVRTRNDKADFRGAVAQAVEAIGGEHFFSGLRHTTTLGWTNQARVDALYQRTRRMLDAGDGDFCDGMFKLWMIGGIELWYGSAILEGMRHGTGKEVGFVGHQCGVGVPRQDGARAVPSPGTH